MPEKVFFNSSLPRSGSTLLQNILAQNPRFYCSATSGLISLCFSARERLADDVSFTSQDRSAMEKAVDGYCRGGMFGYYEALTDRPVCVDKSRGWVFHYEWLNRFFPNPKILVCIRDLRTILSSMEKLYRKNRARDKSESLIPRGINLMGIPNRVQAWLTSNPVGTGVVGLTDASHKGILKKLHIVRYEDLTSNPKATMQKVYEYLEEPSFDHDFDNVEQFTVEDDSHLAIYADHNIRRKVQPVDLDYWEVLGKETCNGIVRTYGFFYSTFYPEKRTQT